MKTKTFIKKKNKIIKKATGLILVPKDQIKNTPKKPLSLTYGTHNLDAELCPYCMAFYNSCTTEDGEKCPMLKAGNDCHENSTWDLANIEWEKKATNKDRKKLEKLVIKYNKGQ